MTVKDLELALWLNGVTPKDAEHILNVSKENGIQGELIDIELVKMGYDKVFDNSDDWNDSEDFDYIEKFPHKNRFLED